MAVEAGGDDARPPAAGAGDAAPLGAGAAGGPAGGGSAGGLPPEDAERATRTAQVPAQPGSGDSGTRGTPAAGEAAATDVSPGSGTAGGPPGPGEPSGSGAARPGGEPSGSVAPGSEPGSAPTPESDPAVEFARRRDGFAAGEGVPAGVAYSPGASRQWVSDELTRSADTLAARGAAAGGTWPASLWRRSLYVIGAGLLALLLVIGLTALGPGWTRARTAALLAAVLTAGLLAGAAWLNRARGGLLAPVVGEDGRLSTGRVVAGAWTLLAGYALLHLALALALADGSAARDRLLDGLGWSGSGAGPGGAAGLVVTVAAVWAAALGSRAVVAHRLRSGGLTKTRAARPRGADLLTDDAGRAAAVDVQYVVVSAAALLFALVQLGRRPEQLPGLPWGVAALVAVSAAVHLAARLVDGGRPAVLSVVRVREPGDLHTAIRTGDDIEVRGTGFVPPGAESPELLARVVVRIGAVHVHVPLVPVPGGFANPAATRLTVPVPVDVEPGRTELRVVTAGGAESAPYLLDIVD
ncbi:hypothetical protein [Streptomyces sp. CNQ-509]|uniref:hypothetical protein n=1 Tax=Streptomyces sp. CNQ-509 TaxID=444103 RepID=UPI000B0B851E|nr:hypothetical protein [Streptomyces sp. CNQ-509]